MSSGGTGIRTLATPNPSRSRNPIQVGQFWVTCQFVNRNPVITNNLKSGRGGSRTLRGREYRPPTVLKTAGATGPHPLPNGRRTSLRARTTQIPTSNVNSHEANSHETNKKAARGGRFLVWASSPNYTSSYLAIRSRSVLRDTPSISAVLTWLERLALSAHVIMVFSKAACKCA